MLSLFIVSRSMWPSYITISHSDSVRRNRLKLISTCGIWSPPAPFMTAPCIWWFIIGGWNERSMFELSMCWNCCWWNKFVLGSSNDCGRVIVSSAGDGWRDPGVLLQNKKQIINKNVNFRRFVSWRKMKAFPFEISVLGTSRLQSFFLGTLYGSSIGWCA